MAGVEFVAFWMMKINTLKSQKKLYSLSSCLAKECGCAAGYVQEAWIRRSHCVSKSIAGVSIKLSASRACNAKMFCVFIYMYLLLIFPQKTHHRKTLPEYTPMQNTPR